MAQMPVVEEGAEPPPYFPRTLVTLRVGMQPVTLRVTFERRRGVSWALARAMGTIINASTARP